MQPRLVNLAYSLGPGATVKTNFLSIISNSHIFTYIISFDIIKFYFQEDLEGNSNELFDRFLSRSGPSTTHITLTGVHTVHHSPPNDEIELMMSEGPGLKLVINFFYFVINSHTSGCEDHMSALELIFQKNR